MHALSAKLETPAPAPLDPMEVVRELAALPHRGATTTCGARAAELLEQRLRAMGASVTRLPFATPRTYVPIMGWLVTGLIGGLLLGPLLPWLGLALTASAALSGLLFLDWRWSPLMLLPPRGRADNLLAEQPAAPDEERPNTLLLMAHFDSAPISLLYLPSMVKGFRRSLFISMAIIVLAVAVSAAGALHLGPSWVASLRWPLCGYFVALFVLASFDFFRRGYTNGAADNATGVGVALATAAELWRCAPAGWSVKVLLTSAEEVSLVGSGAFVRAHGRSLDPARTHVVNFDGFGAGVVRVVRSTGSITRATYAGPIVDAALETAASNPRFAEISQLDWHVGDFDSINFLRAGFPCLALAAITKEGVIPHLHRPSDVLENVDPAVPALGVEFAVATLKRFMAAG
ncbi:MAG: M28 family peptidase [Deltaproteobacteria bacterium]|nr:M28 family peptidase [Deltaproteobacteria bacterium]